MRTNEKLSLQQMSCLLEVVSPREAASLKGGEGSGEVVTCLFSAITYAYNYLGVCEPISLQTTYDQYLAQYGHLEFEVAVANGVDWPISHEFTDNFFIKESFLGVIDLVNFLGTGDVTALVSINQGPETGHAVLAIGYDFSTNEILYRDPEDNPEFTRRTLITNIDIYMMIGITGCKGTPDPYQ